jgi:hypothetical protein
MKASPRVRRDRIMEGRVLPGAGSYEKGLQFGDVSKPLPGLTAARDLIVGRQLAEHDPSLQLFERLDGLAGSAVGAPNRPDARLVHWTGPRAEHLEQVPAMGALDRGAAGRDEGLVELVLRPAALARDVHRAWCSSMLAAGFGGVEPPSRARSLVRRLGRIRRGCDRHQKNGRRGRRRKPGFGLHPQRLRPTRKTTVARAGG